MLFLGVFVVDLLVGVQGAVFFWVVPLGGHIPCFGGYVGTPSGQLDAVARDLILPPDGVFPLNRLCFLEVGLSFWTVGYRHSGVSLVLGALCSAQVS